MNNLDKIFTEDIEKFSRLYFDYLKEIFNQVDVAEIRRFVELILDVRERGSTIFFICILHNFILLILKRKNI